MKTGNRYDFPLGAEWEQEIFERFRRALAWPQTLDFDVMSPKELEAFTELGVAYQYYKDTAIVKIFGGKQ